MWVFYYLHINHIIQWGVTTQWPTQHCYNALHASLSYKRRHLSPWTCTQKLKNKGTRIIDNQAVKQKMIHRFTTSITHAKTLINRYHYFNKVVKGQNLSQRCSPHKEGHFLGYCTVPNTFPWEMPQFSTSHLSSTQSANEHAIRLLFGYVCLEWKQGVGGWGEGNSLNFAPLKHSTLF